MSDLADLEDADLDQNSRYMDRACCLPRFVDPNTQSDVKLPDRMPMVERVYTQLMKKLNPDIVFVLGNKSYGCHGLVLRHFSELYGFYLPTGMVISLPPNKVSHDAFVMIYDWMLGLPLECPRGKLLELLKAAHYFYIPSLVASVFRCLSDKEHYSEADAITTYFEARAMKKWGVAQLMIGCVHKYFMLIICTEEYREMDLACVIRMLSSDNLAIQTEVEVFYAALYWLFAKYEERKDYTAEVLQLVRFVTLDPLFLLTLAKHLHELVPRVADELVPLLEVAMTMQQEIHLGVLSEEEIGMRRRFWVRDPLCPYFSGEKKTPIISPIDFITYVDRLDNAEEYLSRLEEL